MNTSDPIPPPTSVCVQLVAIENTVYTDHAVIAKWGGGGGGGAVLSLSIYCIGME